MKRLSREEADAFKPLIRFHIRNWGWIEFPRFTRNAVKKAIEQTFPMVRRAERDNLVSEVMMLGPVIHAKREEFMSGEYTPKETGLGAQWQREQEAKGDS